MDQHFYRLYLSLNLTIYLFVGVSTYIYSIYSIYIYRFICQTFRPSTYLPIYLSILLPIHISTYPSIYPSIHPSIYLSIYPSIYLSIYQISDLAMCYTMYSFQMVRLPTITAPLRLCKFSLTHET